MAEVATPQAEMLQAAHVLQAARALLGALLPQTPWVCGRGSTHVAGGASIKDASRGTASRTSCSKGWVPGVLGVPAGAGAAGFEDKGAAEPACPLDMPCPVVPWPACAGAAAPCWVACWPAAMPLLPCRLGLLSWVGGGLGACPPCLGGVALAPACAFSHIARHAMPSRPLEVATGSAPLPPLCLAHQHVRLLTRVAAEQLPQVERVERRHQGALGRRRIAGSGLVRRFAADSPPPVLVGRPPHEHRKYNATRACKRASRLSMLVWLITPTDLLHGRDGCARETKTNTKIPSTMQGRAIGHPCRAHSCPTECAKA